MKQLGEGVTRTEWRNLIVYSVVGVVGLTLMQIGLYATFLPSWPVRNNFEPAISTAVVVQLYISYLKLRQRARA
ncbi:MAG: hypothetical protein ABI026_03260 [Gemmatimonadaceae bacterium]